MQGHATFEQACLLVEDVLQSIAPIEQSAVRRLSAEHGSENERRTLTLGDFPKVLIPEPKEQSIIGAVCISEFTPASCDAAMLDYEVGLRGNVVGN